MASIVIGKRMGSALGALALGMAALPFAGAGAVAPDAAGEPLSVEQVEKARGIFTDWSCGACHALADASASGGIGPAFDGNAALDFAFAKDRIMNGQGAMPSFGGQIPDEDIDLLAHYIVQVKQ